MMKIVIIDNYDSFTYNLAHLVKELGTEVTVLRNDQFDMAQLEVFNKIILSPGPGIPSEAGLLLDVIRTYAGRKPILGVCLGHQAIGEVFGGRLENLSDVFHGVATPCHLVSDDPLFSGLDRDITIGRYHSWARPLPKERRPTMVPRSLSWMAPAKISLEEADPSLMRTDSAMSFRRPRPSARYTSRLRCRPSM